jgi:hypothetical protein
MMSRVFTVWTAAAFIVLGYGCSRREPTEESESPSLASTMGSHQARDTSHEVHDKHATHEAPPILPPGQLWATDEPLRTAMQRIRNAVEQAASAQEKTQLTSAQAQALAAVVEDNIAYMIANCKLEAKPDAALHALIGRMLSAAALLKNKSAFDAGVSQLHAVLADYRSSFDHPGWSDR